MDGSGVNTPGVETLFWLKKLCAALLLPPAFPLVLVLAGLLLLRRRPRWGYGLAACGLAMLWLCSAPAGVRLLLDPLESTPPASPAALRQAQAIVVLAGGRNRAPEYGGETVSADTLARLRYGARLARQTGLPLLLGGGAPGGGQPEAVLMDQALRQDFGLAARWIEAGSLDTAGNADASARLLLPAGIRRVALVSDAAHLPRAAAEFRRAGFAVIAAPTRYQGGTLGRFGWLPSGEAAMAGHYAAHEWLGLLAQRLRGLAGSGAGEGQLVDGGDQLVDAVDPLEPVVGNRDVEGGFHRGDQVDQFERVDAEVGQAAGGLDLFDGLAEVLGHEGDEPVA